MARRTGSTMVWAAIAAVLALVLVLLLGWAWIDGGKEPLRQVSVPVDLPGVPR